METLVRVEQLCKNYPGHPAVRDLSFTVNRGDVYGFLGQNGAGKSTTLRMLLSLITPTSGHINMFGYNLAHQRAAVLKQVGAVIERPDLYKYLSAYENLYVFARMSGIKPTRKLLMEQLELVGLADRWKDKVRAYSQGMKQRLGIAVALVHQPELVILDEPTNGLDPQGIADMRYLIRHLSTALGKTIIISSHLLTVIEQLANRMLIIHNGKKMVEGSVHELLDPNRTAVELEAPQPEQARHYLTQSPWASYLQPGNGLHLVMPKAQVPQLVRDCTVAGVDLQAVHTRHSLENYFLSLTNPPVHAEPAVHRTV